MLFQGLTVMGGISCWCWLVACLVECVCGCLFKGWIEKRATVCRIFGEMDRPPSYLLAKNWWNNPRHVPQMRDYIHNETVLFKDGLNWPLENPHSRKKIPLGGILDKCVGLFPVVVSSIMKKSGRASAAPSAWPSVDTCPLRLPLPLLSAFVRCISS